jgi:hypothetical protein
MKWLKVAFVWMFVLDAFAASCPSGYISSNYSDSDLVISASCGTGTTQIGEVSSTCNGDEECFPDYVCGAGVSKVNTDAVVSAPLYSQKITVPSLNVSINSTVCYSPLIEGRTTNAIHMNHNDKVYYATSLKQCRVDFDSSVAPTGSYSQQGNRMDWSLTASGRTITGISYCGDKKPDSGDTVTSVSNSSTDLSANYYCYCRVITPFLSDWYYVTRYTKYGAEGCDTYCYAQCVDSMKSSSTMRAAIYNSMK